MTHELSIAFQTDKRAAEYVALAKLVNQYAFDTVSVYCDAPYHPSYGPLMLMAPYIERARLGPAAISPSRMHPIDIAAQAALLADVAQAGTYIGLARGAWLDDHSIHEVKPAVQAIQEAAEVVNRLLSGQSGYAGDVYQVAEHVKAPYPLPNERIPLLIGTWGKRLCAVAGEIADEVKVGGSANPDLVPVIQSYIAVGEEKAKRPLGTVGVVIGAVSVIDDDREQARAAARRSVAMYLPVIAGLDPTLPVERELLDRIQQQVERNDLEAAAALISDDLLERFAFAGNAADIIGHCERLFDAGAKRVEFGTPHGLQSAEGIRILGEQVLPALADWQQK
ncbi:MAG: 5,10-methylene tetrahydromethanopterin reductase [Anaerolineaceae bacterium]|nr:5,10-methylene tetrahydromethanopterin reductase [Anaerolineaceae bacterium]